MKESETKKGIVGMDGRTETKKDGKLLKVT